MSELTHLDDEGRARMVDVGGKDETDREAVAEAFVSMSDTTGDALFSGNLPKGDARAVARVAAIMGANGLPKERWSPYGFVPPVGPASRWRP
jgi:cyclic pyranopterin phosphate synthase